MDSRSFLLLAALVIAVTLFISWFLKKNPVPLLQISIEQCRIQNSCLTKGEKLGAGNFGDVYKGMLKTSSGKILKVAIKQLKGGAEQSKNDFYLEACRMKPLVHKHVISLLGVSCNSHGNLQSIIIPFMEYRDLYHFVQDPIWALTIGDMLQFSQQIASGMSYLHCNRIIHRDLAARNCMVNSDFNIKIGDFGLARKLEGERLVALPSEPLPIAWLAVESLGSEGKFYFASDVWSFGVTVWELFTRGAMPYGSVAMHLISGHVISGGRLQKPPSCPNAVYDMMRDSCWNSNFERRPSFADLELELANLWHSCTSKDEIIGLPGHHGRGKRIVVGNATVDDSGYVTRKPADFDILSEPITPGRYDPTIYG